MPERPPNILLIMTDQQRADLCAREGFALDTTPHLDSLARRGVWFNRAYTASPLCGPARVSMLTGRFPGATHVRLNHTTGQAAYTQDLFDVMRERGYRTAMIGKNHSHLTAQRTDHWFPMGHSGAGGRSGTEQEKNFDHWLDGLNHGVALEAAPYPVECQPPHRLVSEAQRWVQSPDDQPFFLWLTFAEPHSPYQVPEPYFSMFPPESLPPVGAGREALEGKGYKWQWTRRVGEHVFPNYEELLPRMRANYLGMVRLIDDQIKRLCESLEADGLMDNTLIWFVSDHGDFAGDYGLMRKGPEMPEVLMRIPFFVAGPGVQAGDGSAHAAHVSLMDVLPTLCEAVGAPIPDGAQGRSLWPLLTGEEYPAAEFESVYAEQGFGGLHYGAEDEVDIEDCVFVTPSGLRTFNELNRVSQSGWMRMLRKGDWKLLFDMEGRGQLYNLRDDPFELENLFDRPDLSARQSELLADLLAWTMRAQDPLPVPGNAGPPPEKGKPIVYRLKTHPHNYRRKA